MRSSLAVLCLGWILASCASAQIAKPLAELQLDGEPQPIAVPAGSLLYNPQCGSSGEVYVRYSPAGEDARAGTLVRIQTNGAVEQVRLADVPDSLASSPLLLFSMGADDLLHEIVRIPDEAEAEPGGGQVRYVSFESDGALSSREAFADEFIPSALLPLASGDFFAVGQVATDAGAATVERTLAGIFGPDAQLKQRLQKTDAGLASAAAQQDETDDPDTTSFDSVVPRLGGDGNIYLLLPAESTHVAVISPAGRVLREMELQQPFENGLPDDMWTSANRLLVEYEGAIGATQNATLYVVYDAQTGEVIRQYRPDFSGIGACFQDGQTLTLLVRQPSSGIIAIGTAELQ